MTDLKLPEQPPYLATPHGEPIIAGSGGRDENQRQRCGLIVVHDSHGKSSTFDPAVIASHSDQALAMLADADDRDRGILDAIGYFPNTFHLHRELR